MIEMSMNDQYFYTLLDRSIYCMDELHTYSKQTKGKTLSAWPKIKTVLKKASKNVSENHILWVVLRQI